MDESPSRVLCRNETSPQYSQLVLNACETLQEEVIALFDQTRHSLAAGSATETRTAWRLMTAPGSGTRTRGMGAGGAWESGCPPTCIPSCELLPPVGQAQGW